MRDKRRYHGGGVISRPNSHSRQLQYTIVYRWTPLTDELARIAGGVKGESLKVREAVPADGDGKYRLRSAERLKQSRDKVRKAPDWMPPHIAAKIEAEQQLAEDEQRAPLLFESARDRYLADLKRIGRKARSIEAARGHFRTLERFFAGRMLDTITVADTRDFFVARLKREAPYGKTWRKTPVGPRAPEGDLSTFNALYKWLQRAEARTIANPCIRPVDHGKDSLLARYEPARSKVIPNEEALVEIFTARARARGGGNGSIGRQVITDRHRALWLLIYATAARPESEPCRLTNADIRFLKDDWATVAYLDGKNKHSRRTLPIFPEAAAALKAVMDPEPTRFDRDAHALWAARPVFTKRGDKGEAWDHHSYASAWKGVLSVVPGISGMVCRDLRATANTRLRRAGVALNVRQAFLGHSTRTMEGEYDVINDDDLRAAAEALRLPQLAEKVASRFASCQDVQ